MAKTTSPPFTQNYDISAVTLSSATPLITFNATTGAYSNDILVYTAGPEGDIVKSVVVTSNDTAIRYLTFFVDPGGVGTKIPLFTNVIPISAGLSPAGTVTNVDVLTNPYANGFPVDQSGRPVLPLSPNSKLSVGVNGTAITSNKFIYVAAFGEKY